jgi:hypothetical protein
MTHDPPKVHILKTLYGESQNDVDEIGRALRISRVALDRKVMPRARTNANQASDEVSRGVITAAAVARRT